jgi:hypothetical protein
MAPGPEVLLDINRDYEQEVIGADLMDDERTLLYEIDGIRRIHELGRQLQWDSARVKAAAYPMRSTGWIAKTEESKRRLLLAFLIFVRRWDEAIKLYAGEKGTAGVFGDTSLAADGAGIPPFTKSTPTWDHSSSMRASTNWRISPANMLNSCAEP